MNSNGEKGITQEELMRILEKHTPHHIRKLVDKSYEASANNANLAQVKFVASSLGTANAC